MHLSETKAKSLFEGFPNGNWCGLAGETYRKTSLSAISEMGLEEESDENILGGNSDWFLNRKMY